MRSAPSGSPADLHRLSARHRGVTHRTAGELATRPEVTVVTPWTAQRARDGSEGIRQGDLHDRILDQREGTKDGIEHTSPCALSASMVHGSSAASLRGTPGVLEPERVDTVARIGSQRQPERNVTSVGLRTRVRSDSIRWC